VQSGGSRAEFRHERGKKKRHKRESRLFTKAQTEIGEKIRQSVQHTPLKYRYRYPVREVVTKIICHRVPGSFTGESAIIPIGRDSTPHGQVFAQSVSASVKRAPSYSSPTQQSLAFHSWKRGPTEYPPSRLGLCPTRSTVAFVVSFSTNNKLTGRFASVSYPPT
jgi:hypothetical protein